MKKNIRLQKEKKEEHKKIDHIKLKRWRKVILKQVLNERSGTINQIFIDILDFFGGVGSSLFNLAEDFGDFLFDESDEGLIGMVIALLECDEFDPFDFSTFDKYESGCFAFGYIPPDLPRFPPVLATINWTLNGPNGPVNQPDYESCKSLNFEDGFDNLIYLAFTTFPDIFDFLQNDPFIGIFRAIPFFGTIITRFDGVIIGDKTDFCFYWTILNVAFLLAGIILFFMVFNTFGIFLLTVLFDLVVHVLLFNIGLISAKLQGIERSEQAKEGRNKINQRINDLEDDLEDAIIAARGGKGRRQSLEDITEPEPKREEDIDFEPSAPPIDKGSPPPPPPRKPLLALPGRKRRTAPLPRAGEISSSNAIGSNISGNIELDFITDKDFKPKKVAFAYISPTVAYESSKNTFLSWFGTKKTDTKDKNKTN